MFIKVYATQQLLKFDDLLRESGAIAVNRWLHVLYLMLNLQGGHNELESVVAVQKMLFGVSPHETNLKIMRFVKGVW